MNNKGEAYLGANLPTLAMVGATESEQHPVLFAVQGETPETAFHEVAMSDYAYGMPEGTKFQVYRQWGRPGNPACKVKGCNCWSLEPKPKPKPGLFKVWVFWRINASVEPPFSGLAPLAEVELGLF